MKPWGNSLTFTRHGVRYNKSATDDDLIPQPLRDQVKACLVYWITHGAKLGKGARVQRLRGLKIVVEALLQHRQASFSGFNAKAYETCITLIKNASRSPDSRASYGRAVNVAVNFFQGKNYLGRGIKQHPLANRLIPRTVLTRSAFPSPQPTRGVRRADRGENEKKLPKLEVMLATGNIYAQAMPQDTTEHENDAPVSIDYRENAKDRFVLSYLALTIAAPSRVSEIPLLDAGGIENQTIEQMSQGRRERLTARYLRYRGSKGMVDFSKAIPDVIAPIAIKTTEYLRIACAPGRILARYYEDPSLPLSALLKGTQFTKYKGLEKSAPVDLWQLGGVLGFYDDLPTDSPLHEIPGFPYHCDPAYLLSRWTDVYQLFGLAASRNKPDFASEDRSLRGLQAAWIAHVKHSIPHFPYRQHDNGKRIRLADALFVYTGRQLDITRGYYFGRSPFAIESASLATLYDGRLTGRFGESIFHRYGFTDPRYRLTTHQPRHFFNTLAQKGGMSEEILALWSGRASVAQNAVYDHRTLEEKHSQLVALYEEEDEAREIIVIDADTFEQKTGTPAHKMLTGYCVQSLHINPCLKANECIGCKQNCHVKGDQKNLAIIQADEKVQRHRRRAAIKQAAQGDVVAARWIDIHQEKWRFSQALIEVLTNDEIEDGAIIRFVGDGVKMRICNKEMTESIEYVPQLPPPDKAGEDYLPAPLEEEDPLAALNALISQIAESDDNEGEAVNPLADLDLLMRGD